jgi:hypothetical protein
VEQEIMENNEKKYKQSNHTTFFHFPLVGDFGFKGITAASPPEYMNLTMK